MHSVFSGAVVEETTKGLVFSRMGNSTSIWRGQLASNAIFIDHIIGIQQDKHPIAFSGNNKKVTGIRWIYPNVWKNCYKIKSCQYLM